MRYRPIIYSFPAEVSSNLARFDGIRYGKEPRAESNSLKDVYLKTRGEGFGAEAKRRIILGTFVLSSGYYDAYYEKAQRVRTLVKRDFDEAFKEVDVMLTPCRPLPPLRSVKRSTIPSRCIFAIFLPSAEAWWLPGDFDSHQAFVRPCLERTPHRLSTDRQEMA